MKHFKTFLIALGIVISKENREATQADIERNLSARSGGPGGLPPLPTASFSPVWKPCEFHFNGEQCYNAFEMLKTHVHPQNDAVKLLSRQVSGNNTPNL